MRVTHVTGHVRERVGLNDEGHGNGVLVLGNDGCIDVDVFALVFFKTVSASLVVGVVVASAVSVVNTADFSVGGMSSAITVRKIIHDQGNKRNR